MWKCKCDCGNELVVSGNNLKGNNTKSCGCVKRIPHNYVDLTGKKFGRLTVCKRIENHIFPSGQTRTKYECLCDCGNTTTVISSDLRSGITQSCGCLAKEKSYLASKKYNKYDLSNEYGIGYTYNEYNGINYFYFDLEDYDKIKDYCWYFNDSGYLCSHIANSRKAIRMHRLLMDADLEKKEVDHINHKTFDNRKSNLRLVTSTQNKYNRRVRSDSTTGVCGVRKNNNGKFSAYISLEKHYVTIGTFDNLEDAIAARKEAEEKYFGEYSYANSVDDSKEEGTD